MHSESRDESSVGIDHILCAMLARPRARLFTQGLLALIALGFGGTSAVAQSAEPIGWFVADLRASVVPFGQDPALAASRGFDPTVTPGIGLGLDAGAHVYFYRWRVITFGVGATLHTSVADRPAKEDDLDPTGPTLRKRFTAVAPQLSFNFGGRNGWSYISGGVGPSRLLLFSLDGAEPDQRRSNAVNYGGGARWFVRDHLAFSLDLRFYSISPLETTDTEPGLPAVDGHGLQRRRIV